MHPDRLRRLATLLEGRSGPDALEGLLALSVELLPISGAGIAVIDDRQHVGSVAVSSPSAAAVDALQFTVGEGPCITADRSGAPLLEPDLTAALGQWPAFAPAALALGVAAVFAFPLRVGIVHLGVLTLYASTVGPLDHHDVADAVSLARIATHLLLDVEGALPPGFLPERLEEVVDQRSEVHQATGMIAAQLGTDVATALGRLRAYAWTHDRPIDDVAREVVARSLRFDEAS